MGTNFYIVRKRPTIREGIHVCKRSAGWRTLWQATEPDGCDRWCDDINDTTALPHPIHCVDDIRALLATGEWDLVDEYGGVYPDWEREVDALVAWGGVTGDPRDHAVETGDGYHDRHGNVFTNKPFC